MAGLSIRGVVKRYGARPAVDRVDVEIDSGELVALLGPSGCGKTTLLRLIAGFERLDEGSIHFDQALVASREAHVPPEHRRVGMVFQAYALWPHMNVAENVGYPLRVRGLNGAARAARVDAALEQVGMSGFAQRRPADLSGGQRQRVALARCLVMQPTVVLLDEPLANLDANLRETMQSEFRRFHAASNATMVYVTHDQAEAMALADRIVVMNNGRIEQVGPPRHIYQRPASEMVAEFVGRGIVVDAEVVTTDAEGYCTANMLGASVRTRANDTASGPAKICLRSEQLRLETTPAPEHIPVVVQDATYRGPITTVHVAACADPETILNVDVAGTPPEIGATAHVGVVDAWRLSDATDLPRAVHANSNNSS